MMKKLLAKLAIATCFSAIAGPSQTIQQYRMLVVYTPVAKAAIEGAGNTLTDYVLDWGIDAVNLAYINSYDASRTNQPEVVLAGIQEVNYVSAGNMLTDRNRLIATADGHMDEVHSLRAQYSADIVCLLTNNGSGIAGAIGANAANAFQVTRWNRAQTTFTVAHENGHLFGLRHDFANDPTPGDMHGHTNPNPIWGTIMSYANPRQQFFSNPNLTWNGDPRGVAGTSNAARINDVNAPTIRNLVTLPSTVTVGANDDVDDDEMGSIIASSKVSILPGFRVSGQAVNQKFRVKVSSSGLGKVSSNQLQDEKSLIRKTEHKTAFTILSAKSTSNGITVQFSALEPMSLKIELFDLRGRAVSSARIVAVEGVNEVNFSSPNVMDKVFVLSYKRENLRSTRVIIVD